MNVERWTKNNNLPILPSLKDNVLSEMHDNRTAAEQLNYNSRMQTAILNTIQAKQILNYLIKHMIGSSFNGMKIMYVLN